MIDVPKLRACPPCEIKLTNRANEWPVRPLLAPAVLRPRRDDPMPDFFTPSLVFSFFFFFFSFSLFFRFRGGKSPATPAMPIAIRERVIPWPPRQPTTVDPRWTGHRAATRRADGAEDFRNYGTPLVPGDSSVDGKAPGSLRPRQCHFNYAC